MEVQLLGNVEIHGDDGVVRLARAGERCVLATLAFNPGRQIPATTLADNIWPSAAQPDKAMETAADYVRKVRAAIKKAGGQPGWLRTDRAARSYSLDIDAHRVDYYRFVDLVTTARKSRDITRLQRALSLWQGPTLANIGGLWADNRRYLVESERLDAYYDMLIHHLRVGRYLEVACTAATLIDEGLPTERLLLLGAQGLAGAGQHTAIPGWVDRVTRRMRETVGVMPTHDVLTTLDDLIADPSDLHID